MKVEVNILSTAKKWNTYKKFSR